MHRSTFGLSAGLCLVIAASCSGNGLTADPRASTSLLEATRHLGREFADHANPAALATDAEWVIVGSIEAASLGRAFYSDASEPPAMVTVQVTITIDKVIKGDPDRLGASATVELTVGSEDELAEARSALTALKSHTAVFFADDFTSPSWRVIEELGPTDELILAPWTDGAWLLDVDGSDAVLGIYVDRRELGSAWQRPSTGDDFLAAISA